LSTASESVAEACPSDVLYFESYAHYSIHEEMLKVEYMFHCRAYFATN